MATVRVLKVGYSRSEGPGRQRADCTITLVRSDVNLLVDTGNPEDGPEIQRLLKDEGLTPGDISVVICTHGHSDHVGNNGLFPQAKFIFFHDISQGDLFIGHRFDKEAYSLGEEVQVFATPGHTAEDISVLVRTENGIVAIVGDLFDSEEDLTGAVMREAPGCQPAQQAASRRLILEKADYIIPGHGGIFRAPR